MPIWIICTHLLIYTPQNYVRVQADQPEARTVSHRDKWAGHFRDFQCPTYQNDRGEVRGIVPAQLFSYRDQKKAVECDCEVPSSLLNLGSEKTRDCGARRNCIATAATPAG